MHGPVGCASAPAWSVATDLGRVYTWPDGAQRRALAELAGGWERLLRSASNRVIDDDPDPQIGTLVEWGQGAWRARFLRVRCGTGRSFALPVPVDCLTARQANAWTYGLASMEYELDVRT